MNLGTAFVEVRPDTRAFRRDLEKDTTESAAEVGKKLAGVLAGGAFLAGAKRATDAASDLQQAVGGTEAVFGRSADAVDDWSKHAAEAAGLSERAARELTAQIGGLLKGFGFTSDEAAGLSTQLAQLGADLAATFGGAPEDAVTALGAALRGETDPLERFGIALNQTLVNQKAVELRLAATTSAVDQHAKAQATLALITERSADAQGQFAREADSAAGSAAISAAKAENAAADLGENLLPIYTKLSETVGVVADAFGGLPEPVQTAVIALAGIAALYGPIKAGGEALGALATIARTQLAKGLDAAATGAYSLAGNLGKVTVGAGLLGGAFLAASYVLDQYQKSKADAAARDEEYTRILSEQSDAVHENAAAFAGSEILKGGLGEALREAGADVSTFTDAIAEAPDKVVKLNDKWNGLYTGALNVANGLKNAGLEGSALGDELTRLAESGQLTDDQLRNLLNRLNDQAEGYRNGAREAKNKGEADEEAGVKADTAAPKVENLADKLDINEQASKDAAESMDKFREAVERALRPLDFEGAVDDRTKALADIAAGIDERAQAVKDAQQRLADLQAGRADSEVADARAIADAEERLAEAKARVADTDEERASKARAVADAQEALNRAREDAGDGGASARQIADAQKELDDAIAANTLTLDGNSDAALRNRDTLRDLVDRSVDVIETARDQGRSLEDLQLIRANEIQTLRDQLEQMGFNKDQIDKYVDAIEDIPLTKATTLTVDTAKAELLLEAALKRMQRQIDLNPLSVDVLQAEKFAAGPRSVTGHAAGGSVFDGDFIVGEGGAPELLRKRGSDVEVIAGSMREVGTGGMSADLAALMAEQNALLALIAGNTAGPTTGQRLRRVQTMAGAI